MIIKEKTEESKNKREMERSHEFLCSIFPSLFFLCLRAFSERLRMKLRKERTWERKQWIGIIAHKPSETDSFLEPPLHYLGVHVVSSLHLLSSEKAWF